MQETSIGVAVATRRKTVLMVSVAFQMLWIGQLMSMAGDHLNRVGIIWYVNENLGGLRGEMALGFSSSLPMAIAGIFAGVIVDRLSRTTLLLATDLIRASLVGILAVAFTLFSPPLAFVSVAATILGVSGLLFNPAMQSLLPDLAGGDRETVIKMDAWMLGTMTVLQVVGPTIAGLLVPFVAMKWLLTLDAVSFLISAFMIWQMSRSLRATGVETNVPAPKRKNVLLEAKDGLAFVFRHPVLAPQFALFPLMEAMMYSIPFLLPTFLRTVLHQDARGFGVILAAWALGRVLGMMLLPRTPFAKRRGAVLAANLLMQGLAMLGISLAGNLVAVMVGFFLLGIPGGASTICMSSLIQTEMPKEMRGRIFSAVTSLAMFLVPLGPLMMGTMSAWQGVRAAFMSISLFLIVAGLFIASRRAVRELR